MKEEELNKNGKRILELKQFHVIMKGNLKIHTVSM